MYRNPPEYLPVLAFVSCLPLDLRPLASCQPACPRCAQAVPHLPAHQSQQISAAASRLFPDNHKERHTQTAFQSAHLKWLLPQVLPDELQDLRLLHQLSQDALHRSQVPSPFCISSQTPLPSAAAIPTHLSGCDKNQLTHQ